ncbi:MAG: alpha/beta fold hydrolase [Gammaproteobacteria bacterium]|nr:alpha/beta fold hydrolase [Gammaproteobacteria bacterium]
MLEHIEITTGDSPQLAVIWLHGLGADGHDFEFLPRALESYLPAAVRYVLPHAPVRPITLNGGFPMRAWFDMDRVGIDIQTDVNELEQARASIVELIERETERGLAANQIVLGGFSQGGALALSTGLQYSTPLAGIVGLSTYLSQQIFDLFEQVPPTNTPIFQTHGRHDEILPFELGLNTHDALKTLGCDITWLAYDMPHSVCEQEMDDLGQWLQTRVQ